MYCHTYFPLEEIARAFTSAIIVDRMYAKCSNHQDVLRHETDLGMAGHSCFTSNIYTCEIDDDDYQKYYTNGLPEGGCAF